MTVSLPRPATPDGLFVWVMHRFAEVFEEHAIVKGGMAMRLLDCPRSTTDIDYVFVPYTSKNQIVELVRATLDELGEIAGATVTLQVHSKAIRAQVRVDDAAIQIEANVAAQCASLVVPTASLALPQGQPSRLVRIMDPDVALAHQLAAWNERRLLRDLYDVYHLSARLGAQPDRQVLAARLAKVESRLPALRGRRSMSLDELSAELQQAVASVDGRRLDEELAPILPPEEVAGLGPRLRSGVGRVVEWLAESR